MGKLFDDFGELSFSNEAEVSQNFIQPLLQNFLGYSPIEILPETFYPAKEVFSGVNFNKNGSKGLLHRPDFVVCLNGDRDQPRFIIDSKGPNEKIDSHLGQLQSYALSVGVNFLMMSNGTELRVYDVNLLLFHANDINDLQLRMTSLLSILGRENQSIKSALEILREFKHDKATISATEFLDKEIQRRKVLLADFQMYLTNISNAYMEWHTPTLHFQALDNLELSKIDPNVLLRFQLHDISDQREKKQFSLHSIEHDQNIKIKIFVGDTGTGKSCLLKYLSYQSSSRCLASREVKIPVFVQLREIGHQYNLEHLIVASLNRNGYNCRSLYELPKKNEFIFYLDAFDEIGEQFQEEISNAIENLAASFECYITTRPNKIPNLRPSVTYELLPISDWQAKRIIQKHLNDRYYEFHRKLEDTKLNSEAGNILLLLCLISLFKESGTLPKDNTNVISSIVKRIESWQNSKKRHKSLLSWEIVEYFLSLLAYKIIESEQTSISRSEVESLIVEAIIRLEHMRKIPAGQSVDNVLGDLQNTGLFLCSSDSMYFWHRLFLNHFAALGLKLHHRLDEKMVKTIAEKERWHLPILHLASMIEDVTPLVAGLRTDIWLAVQCLSYNSNCEETLLKEIIERLLTISKSEIPELRVRASHFLVKIECDYVLNILYQAIEEDFGGEIKMYALSAVAKTKSDRARNLILKHLKWNDSSFFSGRSSQVHICRALYHYGETEHLLIIENWKEIGDYMMSLECGRIFTDLYNQGNFTPKLINQLRSWFWEMVVDGQASIDKADELVKVLSFIPDTNFSLRVLDWQLKSKKHNLDSAVEKLMMGTKSAELMEELKSRLLNDEDKGSYLIFRLTDVACRSDITMPIEFYLELAGSININIASSAVAALGRFRFEVSKQAIETHLYGNQPQLQSAAVKALMENGEIINLVRDNRFPKYFYNPTVYSVLKAVRRYNLFDAIYILDSIFDYIDKNNIKFDEVNIAIGLAGTYRYIGEHEKYKVIISWYFDGNKLIQASDFIHHHLVKHIKYFDRDMAMKIVLGYFDFYFPFDFEETGGHKMEVFLEAAEEIGRHELVACIKKIVEHLLVDTSNSYHPTFHLERPMRALTTLVQPSDEDWILGNLDSMKTNDGFQFPELRRSAECLSFCGTRRSLPYLQTIAKQFKNKEAIVNVCQLAFEQICLREGLHSQYDVLTYSE